MEFLEFPILIHLKELELTACASGSASLLDFSSLINAAPVLYRFALKVNLSCFTIDNSSNSWIFLFDEEPDDGAAKTVWLC